MKPELTKSGILKIKPHMLNSHLESLPPAAIFLNSNENTFGPSPKAIEAAKAAVTGIERYIDNVDAILCPAIADHFELEEDRITIGQGSDDLLARLARAFLGPKTELIRSSTGYLKVPNYAYANDASVISVPHNMFKTSVESILSGLTARTRLVYIANPENPAGTYLKNAELRKIHSGLPSNVLLVVDAAYEEYVDATDYETPCKLVEETNNVVVCKTFSKIFGLAGARIGWAYGPKEIIQSIKRISLTFPVATPSIAAALSALEDKNHTEYIFQNNKYGRAYLQTELEALGLRTIPSQANFLLVNFPRKNKSAKSADKFLLSKGIMVRRFAHSEYQDYLRITIGKKNELEKTIKTISEFLINSV